MAQQYLPNGLQGNYFYKPGDQGFEKKVADRMEWLRKEQEEGLGKGGAEPQGKKS